MIDYAKEKYNFEYFCRDYGDINLASESPNRYKNKQTQRMWTFWKAKAKEAQQEIEATKRELEFATKTINDLLDKLEAKHKAYIFLDDCRKEWHTSFMRKCEENEELKAKLAKYESDNFVLVPTIPTMPMLIKGRHSVERLLNMPQLEKLYKAMIEAGEIK